MKRKNAEKTKTDLLGEHWKERLSFYLIAILKSVVIIVLTFQKPFDHLTFIVGFLVTMIVILVYIQSRLDKMHWPEAINALVGLGIIGTIIIGFLLQVIVIRFGLAFP